MVLKHPFRPIVSGPRARMKIIPSLILTIGSLIVTLVLDNALKNPSIGVNGVSGFSFSFLFLYIKKN